MKAPQPVERKYFDYDEDTVKRKNIDTLSPNLRVAIMELRDNPVIRDVLGEETFRKYYEGKRKNGMISKSKLLNGKNQCILNTKNTVLLR